MLSGFRFRDTSALLGGRLTAGRWTLAPSTEVRILAPQPIYGVKFNLWEDQHGTGEDDRG
jgi:hypothetical protein